MRTFVILGTLASLVVLSESLFRGASRAELRRYQDEKLERDLWETLTGWFGDDDSKESSAKPETFTPQMTSTAGSVLTGRMGRQKWGYVDLRQGAHMFWWLHLTTHPDGYEQRPLIIWLQGGPGYSSTGIGNFQEIGPLTVDLLPRETTWVQEASVLFIDSPVGCGYSYVDDVSSIPNDINKISEDLLIFLRVFLEKNPEFRSRPIYLFGQSFGGKMVTNFGRHLQQEIMAGTIDCQLQGVAIGNGFVSPIDFVNGYGKILFEAGLFGDTELEEAEKMILRINKAVDTGLIKQALFRLEKLLGYIMEQTGNVEFYDIRRFTPQTATEESEKPDRYLSDSNAVHKPINFPRFSIYDTDLWPLMNGPIREQLGVIPDSVIWGAQNDSVYMAQMDDLMRPTVPDVDWLLQNSDVHIIVYEGQFDLACETSGAIAWIQKLKWPGLMEYNNATRTPIRNPVTGEVEAYVKATEKLKFYWNLGSGHTVPADVPEPALRMLQRILTNEDH